MRYSSIILRVNILLASLVGLCLQGCSSAPPSINRALIIGISKNQKRENTVLPVASVDAQHFGEKLFRMTKHLRIVIGKDKQLTRANLLDELHQFAKQSNQTEVVWLMLEGHGIEIDGDDYFYLVDSKLKNGKPAKETLIGMQDILQALTKIRAKELIITLALNTTSSGLHPLDYPAVFGVRLSGSQMDYNWKMPTGVGSLVTFTFSGLEHRIPGVPLVNPFTYYLAKGLEGGAADQEGNVKVMNLLRYVQLGVSSNIQLFGGNIGRCSWSVAAQDKTKALNAVLANNLPPGLGGKTAVSLSPHPDVKERRNAAMLRAFELQMEIEQRMTESGEIADAVRSHSLLPVMRASLAPVKNQFLKALHYDPNFLLAYYNLGILEVKLNDWSNAQKHFQRAMDIDPQSPILIWRMALLMQGQKKYQEAERYYKKAIVLTSDNNIIRYNLARLYIDAHEFEKAKKLLLEIIQKEPRWSKPLERLSYIYYVSGEKTQAINLLQQAYNLDHDNPAVLYRLAWNYCHVLKDYQKSEQLYRRLIKLSPKNGLYLKEFAVCLFQEGNVNEAKAQAKKAINLGYRSNDPLFKKLKMN